MNWNGIGDLLAMGGYGLYVWGSFGVVAACVALETWLVRQRARRLRGDRP